MNGQSPQSSQDFKKIWRATIPNKIKHFLWILYHKRAKTNQRLHSLGMLNTPNCSICGCHNEDASHLFFKCYIAKQFWQKVLHSQRIRYKFDGSTLDSSNWMEYWSKISGKPCSSILNWETPFPYCLWHIWNNRNANYFEHKSNLVNLACILGLATEFVALRPNRGKPQNNMNTIQVKWYPLRNGMTKLNIDGIVHHAPGPWGYGRVFRNRQGIWSWASTKLMSTLRQLK